MQRVTLSGLISPDDVPAHEIPPEFWTRADNVNFRAGVAQRVNGWRSIYGAATDAPIHILNSYFAGVNYWIYVTDLSPTYNEIYAVSANGTHTDISSLFPIQSDPNLWSSCELNGVPFLNWGSTGGPVYWDLNPANNIVNIPDWPSGYSCKVLRSFKNYLLAGNINDGTSDIPSMVMWSDAANPGQVPDDGNGTTWDPLATNDAGDLALGGAAEGITDMLALRDTFMVYKNHAMFQMYYIGGQLIFGQRQMSRTAGALAQGCVAEYRGIHIALADNDVIFTDGQQIRSLVNARARRALFSKLDLTNFDRSYVVTNTVDNEVWVCIPETGAEFPTLALVWDAESDRVSFRDLLSGGSGTPHIASGNVAETANTDTWATVAGTWATITTKWSDYEQSSAVDGLVGIDYDTPTLILMDEGITRDVGSVNMVLRRESLDFGDVNSVKFVREVWPRITGTAGATVNVRVGVQDQSDDPIEWGPTYPYIIGTTQKVEARARGRFISFELQSTDDMEFRCTGMDVWLRAAGRWAA